MAFPAPFYLPAYAYDIGQGSNIGTYLLATMTGFSAVSTLVVGPLVPYLGTMNIYCITQFIAAISIFLFWVPSGSNLGLLFSYAAIYGLFWGCFWSLLAGSMATVFTHLDVFPVVIGSAYFAAALSFFANAPVFGALVDLGATFDGQGNRTGANYIWGQVWAGSVYLAGVACIAIVRFWSAGWKLKVKV